MTCTAEVTVGQQADGWSCGGGTASDAKYGILGIADRKVIVVTTR